LENVQKIGETGISAGQQSNFVARLKRIDKLFAAVVLLPSLVSTLYFTFIAADVYVSTSTFVVRSPQKSAQAGSLFGSFLQSSGLARADDDTHAVNDYMLSRDALTELNKGETFRNAYGGDNGDVFSRFGTLGLRTSFEDLLKYFQRRVEVHYDTTTSITTLTVEAYSAKEAQTFNLQLLDLGEKRVNEMNSRAAQDAVRYAAGEVERAQNAVRRTSAELLAFREHQSVFDPEKQSALDLQQASQIQMDLKNSSALLAQLQSVAPANPQIPVLKTRIDTLRRQINETTQGVAGGRNSLANKNARYERLALDRDFAEKQLASAQVSLETARNEAIRQQLYLERIAQPNAPDKALLPHRIRNIAATLILSLLVWASLRLLLASVREHRD
jgi:capsular polysaccharide transport system permease protein